MSRFTIAKCRLVKQERSGRYRSDRWIFKVGGDGGGLFVIPLSLESWRAGHFYEDCVVVQPHRGSDDGQA